ncbi:MAG: hypothetical protein RR922_06740 [Clostridia bacterium]
MDKRKKIFIILAGIILVLAIALIVVLSTNKKAEVKPIPEITSEGINPSMNNIPKEDMNLDEMIKEREEEKQKTDNFLGLE